MLLEGLSEEQKKAVTEPGNILLTACPGSGKTRVIVYKIAHTLAQVHSWDKKILALTFTVRAADEMLKRLNKINIAIENIWAGTLHAFCLEWIMKPYHQELPELRAGFKIAEEAFCNELISRLKEKYRVNPAESINLKFNRQGQPLEKGAKYREILSEYQQTLKEKNLIDFDLLLFYSYRILLQSKDFSLQLAKRFRLICVDEYQDTQDLQYAIISLLVKVNPGETSVFFVGDVDQAIYKSLGGIAKTHSEIRSDMGGLPLKAMNLSANYRSSQRIIDFYRNFQNQNIKIKALGKYAKEGGLITLNQQIHHSKLVPELIRLIKLSLKKGVPEEEICVLVPQWWLVTSISKQLKSLLPEQSFSSSVSKEVLEHRENLFSKLLRLFLYLVPDDGKSNTGLLYSGTRRKPLRRRLEEDFYEKLSKFIKVEREELISEELAERIYLNILGELGLLEPFYGEQFKELMKSKIFSEIFKEILEKNIFSADYQLEEWHISLQKELREFFIGLDSLVGSYKLKDFQEFKVFYKRLLSSIVVNTCMGVKGEEFETVIAYGLLRGYVPHWSAIMAGDERETSQRLLYVICSRAKLNLHLIAERGRTTANGKDYEINRELDEVVFDYDVV